MTKCKNQGTLNDFRAKLHRGDDYPPSSTCVVHLAPPGIEHFRQGTSTLLNCFLTPYTTPHHTGGHTLLSPCASPQPSPRPKALPHTPGLEKYLPLTLLSTKYSTLSGQMLPLLCMLLQLTLCQS